MRRSLILTFAAAAAAAMLSVIASSAAAAPPLTTVSCGQTLAHSVRLANDLIDCPGDGLVMGVDGITIDLNGHTVDGTNGPVADCDSVDRGGPAGVDNSGGRDDLVIENGTLQQFANGVAAGSDTDGMVDSRLQGLTLRDNRFSGIDIGAPGRLNADDAIEQNVASGNGCGFGIALSGARRTHIADNQVLHNGLGILICCSDHTLVEHNRVWGTDHDAVIACCADDSHNVLRDNTVTHSKEAGIDLCCDGNDLRAVIAHNTVAANAGEGIQLEGVSDDEILANDVRGNGGGIAGVGDRNTFADNHVSNAYGCSDGCGFGISLEGGRDDLIARNLVSGTLRDGIRIESFAIFGAPPTVDALVRDNHVRGAGIDGFSGATEVGGPVSGLLLDGNMAQASGDDGFDVRSPGSTLRDNFALRNVDLGIDAVAGVTDGGGNRAVGNGNPLQCTNVLCAGG